MIVIGDNRKYAFKNIEHRNRGIEFNCFSEISEITWEKWNVAITGKF